MAPYEVEGQWWVKAKDGAALTSGPVAVKVDREDPQLVAIDWETVRREYEARRQARQEALASGHSPVTVNISDPQAGDIAGGDLGKAEEALRSLGVDVDLQGAVGSAAARHATGAQEPPAAGQEQGDALSKLERLAALRASGALTEEEFEAQKRRILGG